MDVVTAVCIRTDNPTFLASMHICRELRGRLETERIRRHIAHEHRALHSAAERGPVDSCIEPKLTGECVPKLHFPRCCGDHLVHSFPKGGTVFLVYDMVYEPGTVLQKITLLHPHLIEVAQLIRDNVVICQVYPAMGHTEFGIKFIALSSLGPSTYVHITWIPGCEPPPQCWLSVETAHCELGIGIVWHFPVICDSSYQLEYSQGFNCIELNSFMTVQRGTWITCIQVKLPGAHLWLAGRSPRLPFIDGVLDFGPDGVSLGQYSAWLQFTAECPGTIDFYVSRKIFH